LPRNEGGSLEIVRFPGTQTSERSELVETLVPPAFWNGDLIEDRIEISNFLETNSTKWSPVIKDNMAPGINVSISTFVFSGVALVTIDAYINDNSGLATVSLEVYEYTVLGYANCCTRQ